MTPNRTYSSSTERADHRTPVHIDGDVYDALRELAREDDRSIARYVNRVLAAHVRRRGRSVAK